MNENSIKVFCMKPVILISVSFISLVLRQLFLIKNAPFSSTPKVLSVSLGNKYIAKEVRFRSTKAF